MTVISGYVITLNEEKHIRRCLESLSWCDEIIVVDSYSDDKTVEIAKEYTDKVFFEEERSDFDSIRDKAIEESSGDWVIQIDADEEIPEELAQKIQEIISEDSADVIRAPRKNLKFGKWIKEKDSWPDYIYCAYKKELTKVTGEIHDFLEFENSARIEALPAEEKYAVRHDTIEDLSQYYSKLNRYSSEEKVENPSLIKAYLAAAYTFLRRLIYSGLWKYGRVGAVVASIEANYVFVKHLKGLEEEFNKNEV